MSATRSPASIPAASSPLATAVTSPWKAAAVTPSQPSAPRRLKTTSPPWSRALLTTSSVRLPDVGSSKVGGVEYSRTCGRLPPGPVRRSSGPAHPVRSLTGDPAALWGCGQGRGGRAQGVRDGRADHFLHHRRRTSVRGHGRHRRLRRLPPVGEGCHQGRDHGVVRRRTGRAGVLRPRREPDQGRVHARLRVERRPGGHLDAGRGQDAPRPRRRLRAARPRRRLHRGDLPARARRLDPADRDAEAQGREDPHRHRAQGAEEARRVPCLGLVLGASARVAVP